jgi:hypothetical protein
MRKFRAISLRLKGRLNAAQKLENSAFLSIFEGFRPVRLILKRAGEKVKQVQTRARILRRAALLIQQEVRPRPIGY